MIGLHIELAVKIQFVISTTLAGTLILLPNCWNNPTINPGRKQSKNAAMMMPISTAAFRSPFLLDSSSWWLSDPESFPFGLLRRLSDLLLPYRPTNSGTILPEMVQRRTG